MIIIRYITRSTKFTGDGDQYYRTKVMSSLLIHRMTASFMDLNACCLLDAGSSRLVYARKNAGTRKDIPDLVQVLKSTRHRQEH